MEPTVNDPSQLSEREQMKLWVETWKRTGVELERIRKEELRALTEEQSAADLFDGFDLLELPEYPPTSGLVEQQRWFAKAVHLLATA
jgi:hypothetical protein